VLVLAQSWDPGWSATVNGERAEVLRVNLGFQGVVVPGGKAVVVLRYREPGLVLGFGVTVLALGVCVFLGKPRREGGTTRLRTTDDRKLTTKCTKDTKAGKGDEGGLPTTDD
jgi:hypothetical protein